MLSLFESSLTLSFLLPFSCLFDFRTYFTALVDSYTRVLLPPRNIVEKFKSPEQRDKTVVLDKAMSYMEWESLQDRERKKAEEEEENERSIIPPYLTVDYLLIFIIVAMSMIDWHDFVVVETIEFFDDEADLPAPPTVAQLESNEDMEMEMEDEAPAPPPEKPAEPAPPVEEPSPPVEAAPPLPPPETKLRILKEPLKRMSNAYFSVGNANIGLQPRRLRLSKPFTSLVHVATRKFRKKNTTNTCVSSCWILDTLRKRGLWTKERRHN